MLTSRPQGDVLKACEAGVLKAEAKPERADKL
jgi:hypothetical protein